MAGPSCPAGCIHPSTPILSTHRGGTLLLGIRTEGAAVRNPCRPAAPHPLRVLCSKETIRASSRRIHPNKKWAAKVLSFTAARPWVFLKLLQCCAYLKPVYCKSLVTSCCTLLACANAAMPVWLRISYFDMFEVADA